MLLSEHEDKHNVAKLHNFHEELLEAGLSQLCNSNFHCDKWKSHFKCIATHS